MSTFLHQLTCSDGLHKCVVEDDGRVAYAYLFRDGKIIGDLWLYNQAESPTEPEWRDRSKLPFLNPAAFLNTKTMAQPLGGSEDLTAKWEVDANGIATRVKLYLHGHLYGVLAPEAKPGWCVAAIKDGPLAKCLTQA